MQTLEKANLTNSFSLSATIHHIRRCIQYNSQSPQQWQEELLCNEEEVYQLLSFLDVTKANGTNGISALTLKHTIL